jgi:hypothetical protein
MAVLGGRLEQTWGTAEYGKFLGVANVSVGLTLFFFRVFMYIAGQDEGHLYGASCGTTGLVVAILVGISQLGLVYPVGTVAFPSRLAPLALLVAASVLQLILPGGSLGLMSSGKSSSTDHLEDPFFSELPGAWVAFVTAWVWLRQRRENPDGSIGDARREFGIDIFFPGPLQAIVAAAVVMANIAFAKCMRRKIDQSILPT